MWHWSWSWRSIQKTLSAVLLIEVGIFFLSDWEVNFCLSFNLFFLYYCYKFLFCVCVVKTKKMHPNYSCQVNWITLIIIMRCIGLLQLSVPPWLRTYLFFSPRKVEWNWIQHWRLPQPEGYGYYNAILVHRLTVGRPKLHLLSAAILHEHQSNSTLG